MVRPLDMQQILLQSNTIERVQQTQQQYPDIQQKYFGDQLNKEQSLLKEKVKDLEESERLMIKEKDKQAKRKKKHKDSREKAKKQDSSNVSNGISADDLGIRLDIKV